MQRITAPGITFKRMRCFQQVINVLAKCDIDVSI